MKTLKSYGFLKLFQIISSFIIIHIIQGVRAKLAYIPGNDRGGPDDQKIVWEGKV